MMAARSMQVQYLERRAEGELTLGDLPRGECRLLSHAQCQILRMQTAQAEPQK